MSKPSRHVKCVNGVVWSRYHQDRRHLTLCVEGWKDNDWSTAGVALDLDQLEKLVTKLSRQLENWKKQR